MWGWATRRFLGLKFGVLTGVRVRLTSRWIGYPFIGQVARRLAAAGGLPPAAPQQRLPVAVGRQVYLTITTCGSARRACRPLNG